MKEHWDFETLTCTRHHKGLDFVAGASAHPSNWYCTECEKEKEISDLRDKLIDAEQRIGRYYNEKEHYRGEFLKCQNRRKEQLSALFPPADGPESEDGYDHEGFVGGCERMQCPGWMREHQRAVDWEDTAKFWILECVAKENQIIALRKTVAKLQEESDAHYALANEWEEKCIEAREQVQEYEAEQR